MLTMGQVLSYVLKVHQGIKLTKILCPGDGVCVWKLTISNKHNKVSEYKVCQKEIGAKGRKMLR